MVKTKSTEREIQEAYSDASVAARYVANRFHSELHRLLHRRQTGFVNRWIRKSKPERILEIAPGTGRLTRDIRTRGSLTCLEYNQAMINEGRKVCASTVEWVQGNAFELPFDEQFDLVYTFRFIRHFQLDDRRRLYDQIRRVLRPGGMLIFDAVNRTHSEPLRTANPEDYPIYDHLYEKEELLNELVEAGLPAVELEPVQRQFTLQYKSQVLVGPRSRWLNRMVIGALEASSRKDGLEWIVRSLRK